MYSPGTSTESAQSRSVIVTTGGIVASESAIASQVGATLLAQGGNAVDAAVAVNAVMGVVAPHSNGIGGDLFALLYDARSASYFGLNASGWSPQGLDLKELAKRGLSAVPVKGILSVSIPGAVDGWNRLLDRFGKLDLSRVLGPAIQIAEQGFVVTERSAVRWQENQGSLVGHARKILIPEDRTPRFGEIFRNHELAASLKRIASGGRDVFYRGEIADKIIALSETEGGLIEGDDLTGYESVWVDPIFTTYRNSKLYELPPNSTGIAALLMLNILEQFPLSKFGSNSPDALHYLIEAKKLAYADMLQAVCDPDHLRVRLTDLLAKEYGAERAELIARNTAMEKAFAGEIPSYGGDTVYLSVVDRDGNMVSLIQSNYMNFGSGLMAEGTGFVLQNRANLFSSDPLHPNVVAGRKRPLHTILPAFLEIGGRRIAFGIQGGWNQPLTHAQFVSNIVDHGMNLQAAMESPRFTKLTFDGVDVQVESRIDPSIRQELEQRGHSVEVEGAFSETMGGGQAVMREESTGVNHGASDPRKDGAAIPEPLFYDDRIVR
jgi:gamma-glutamyltranspeptidase/glutathione hydrolase